MLSQIFPSWISRFNQRNLFVPAPAFQLPLAVLCRIHVVIFFVIHQPIALVFLGESIDLAGFVLEDARVNKACHANIERAGSAGVARARSGLGRFRVGRFVMYFRSQQPFCMRRRGKWQAYPMYFRTSLQQIKSEVT